jgi:hypothetical protein
MIFLGGKGSELRLGKPAFDDFASPQAAGYDQASQSFLLLHGASHIGTSPPG